MKKTIVIPTDFSVGSLNLIKLLLNTEEKHVKLDIIMLHGVKSSDSITELLFFSKNAVVSSLTNPSFEEACGIIRNKYASQLHCIRKDIFSGTTQAAFNQYAAANGVDAIYIPASYRFTPLTKRSFDVLPYIQRSHVPCTTMRWEDPKLPEKGNLAEIFYNGATVG